MKSQKLFNFNKVERENSLAVLMDVYQDNWDRTYISVSSLARYCHNNLDFAFLAYDLDWKHKQQLLTLNSDNINIRIVDMSDFGACEWAQWQGLYRIPEIFPKADIILCISVDIVACADISDLWKIDMDHCSIAAAPQIRNNLINSQIESVFEKKSHPFVNTDVMLVSRKNFLRKRHLLVSTLYKYPGLTSFKSAIVNLAFYKDILVLPLEWNCPFEPEFWDSRNEFIFEEDRKCYELSKLHPYFMNYGGMHKPWSYQERPESQYYLKIYGDINHCIPKTFRFTVITPAYNCGRYLNHYFDSLIEQTIDFRENIQVIIVDDGSTDDTGKICKEYVNKYPENIIYTFQIRKGILAARNRAIGFANGEFLFFLDADDYLQVNFFKSVETAFTRLGKGINVLGVPFQYIDGMRESRSRQDFGREMFCKLDLYTDYGICINHIFSFVFRRRENCFFSENLSVRAAEINYICTYLDGKRNIGWANGTHVYVRARKDKSALLNVFLQSKEIFIPYFSDFWKGILLDHKRQIGFIPSFLQYSYMEEMISFSDMWSNTEITDSKITAVDFWEAAESVLKLIDDFIIIDSLGMHDMPRILLVLEKKYGIIPQTEKFYNDIIFKFGNTAVGKLSYQTVLLHFIKIEKETIWIEGESSVPAFLGKNAARIWIEANGTVYQTDSLKRETEKDLLGECYENGITFSFQYPLTSLNKVQFRFLMQVQNIQIAYHAVIGLRFSPVSNEVKNAYAVQGGYALWITKDTLYCQKADEYFQYELEINYQQELKKSGELGAVRAARFRRYLYEAKKLKKRPIWLFFDRIDKADDNGEAMFRYIAQQKKLNIEAYFVIEKGKDYERLAEIGNVVQANSLKHQFLYAMADYVITSQVNGFIENPFGAAEKYYRDILHTPKVIFLQHGVTKDNQTKWLNRFNQDLYAIVTSCKSETDSILSYAYYYKPEQVWLTGMPRFDRLYHDEKKYILIMPTWRKQFMEQRWCKEKKAFQWEPLEDFNTSEYCIKYHSLLCNERLFAACCKYGYKLVFMAHPIVQPYQNHFQIPDYVVTMPYGTSWRDLFAWSSLMVTDYSSVAFDFAYLQKPVIYYQFDKEDFFGSHTYTKGYFDYEKNGFGEIAEKEDEVVKLLEEYMKNDCKIKECYRNRVTDFYEYQDTNNCARLLEQILHSEKEEKTAC